MYGAGPYFDLWNPYGSNPGASQCEVNDSFLSLVVEEQARTFAFQHVSANFYGFYSFSSVLADSVSLRNSVTGFFKWSACDEFSRSGAIKNFNYNFKST